ncbi:hypothetical protein KR084_003704, partial [Drosophila pseudotakahashii]
QRPEPDVDGHNYAEIDVVNDTDFSFLTNLNHYYQQQRLQSLRQSLNRHVYCNLPVQQSQEQVNQQPMTKSISTSTSTSPWHEPKAKSKPLQQLLRKPKKWKLKRTLDDFLKCLIIASSEHVYDYDVLW